ncbi:hypothetical protein KUV57_12245 [Epibacterium sp. DP7N7-1]|nr:hypothetical protein [Epibacterium sp. DP7N7-1]
MKKATGSSTSEARLRFLQESCIRTNTAALCEAAWTMGHVGISITAMARQGLCTLSYASKPDGDQILESEDWPDVTVRKLSDEGMVEIVTISFAKAMYNLMQETIEFGHPTWREVEQRQYFRLVIEDDIANLTWKQEVEDAKDTASFKFEPHPSDVFVLKPIIASTPTGTWYEIENQKQGNAAGVLSNTAVGHFYSERCNAPARWFIHLEMEGEVPVAGIVLAAQPEEGFNPSVWPHISHVTGRHNADLFCEREMEIRGLAQIAGLVVEPNWMGKPLPQDVAPLIAEEDPAARILRAQLEQGWTTETLEMLSRRFIETKDMSAEYAEFLEGQAALENGVEPEGEGGPGL